MEGVGPLLQAIADSAGLLARGDDNSFMNRVTLALRDRLQPTGSEDTPPPKELKVKPAGDTKAAPKGQSHIRQARAQQPAVKVPESGPMAAMLKKLFGKGES